MVQAHDYSMRMPVITVVRDGLTLLLNSEAGIEVVGLASRDAWSRSCGIMSPTF